MLIALRELNTQGLNYLSASVQKRAKSLSDVEQLLEGNQKEVQRLQGWAWGAAWSEPHTCTSHLLGLFLPRWFMCCRVCSAQVWVLIRRLLCETAQGTPLCLKPTTVTASPQKAKKNAQTNVLMQMQGFRVSHSFPAQLPQLRRDCAASATTNSAVPSLTVPGTVSNHADSATIAVFGFSNAPALSLLRQLSPTIAGGRTRDLSLLSAATHADAAPPAPLSAGMYRRTSP